MALRVQSSPGPALGVLGQWAVPVLHPRQVCRARRGRPAASPLTRTCGGLTGSAGSVHGKGPRSPRSAARSGAPAVLLARAERGEAAGRSLGAALRVAVTRQPTGTRSHVNGEARPRFGGAVRGAGSGTCGAGGGRARAPAAPRGGEAAGCERAGAAPPPPPSPPPPSLSRHGVAALGGPIRGAGRGASASGEAAMDAGGGALGKRRGAARPRGKPRPQSYQSPGGLLVTDFPVEDRCAFTLAQPAATVSAAPRGGSPRLPARVGSEPPAGLLALLSSASLGFVANGAFPAPGGPQPRGARGEAERGPAGPEGISRAMSPERGVAPPAPLPEQPAVTLSTHSPAALKVGTQQIIPRSLASDSKAAHKGGAHGADAGRRVLKARSMVESPGVLLGADEETEGEPDSPGVLRRGLRSTSYRRAVVSGIDLDGSANFKKKNRMSQPILKAVVEDKEKFSSLGRTKVMVLCGGALVWVLQVTPAQLVCHFCKCSFISSFLFATKASL